MAGINGFPGFVTDFVRGTTKDFKISIQKDGLPVNLTGCKFYLTFSEALLPSIAHLEIIIDPPSSPLTGEAVGVITDTETFTFDVRTYFYSLRLVNADGATYVIDMGKVKVFEAVSEKLE